MCNLVFIDNPIYVHPVDVTKITEDIEKMDISSDNKDESLSDDFNYDKTVLSIDIGIHHLGLSVGLIDKAWNLLEITWVNLINITEYSHNLVCEEECKLQHCRCVADWLEHVFQEYEPVFREVDYILLERQPLQGLVAIEQVIYYRWRFKCSLVSPRSMHKHFMIGYYDYERRKEKTVQIASKVFWNDRAIEYYNKCIRQHDIADSICLMMYWLKKHHDTYVLKKLKDDVSRIKMTSHGFNSIDDWFAQFRYVAY